MSINEQQSQSLAYHENLVSKKRSGASVNVYLILRQKDKLLLQLRKNTGYCDGQWGFMAGHVEDGESAMNALVREAQEEIGIMLDPKALKVAHVMHRQTNRFNVDIFFEAFSYQGILQNNEEHKCAALKFFSLNELPSNIIDYVAVVLESIKQQQYYSEYGWNHD